MSGKRVERTRAGSSMTEGAFRSFIKSTIRRMTTRWKPKYDCKKNARHHEKLLNSKGRLVFHSECNICKELVPETTATVDHIEPIVNPATGVEIIPIGRYEGMVDWNPVIYGALCEEEGLQTLCTPCHDKKTKQEKAIDTERRRQERAS